MFGFCCCLATFTTFNIGYLKVYSKWQFLIRQKFNGVLIFQVKGEDDEDQTDDGDWSVVKEL